MDLTSLTALAQDFAPYVELREQIKRRQNHVLLMDGVSAPAKGFLLSKLLQDLDRPVLLITYNNEQAESLANDLIGYGLDPELIATLPSTSETLLYTEGAPDYALIGRRLRAMRRLVRNEARIVIGPVSAVLQRTAPIELWIDRETTLTAGQTLDLEVLGKTLTEYGYERVESAELPGQWTRRGGLIDVFPGDAPQPVRLDFFGDEIETIRSFDPNTQRSTGKLESIVISPVREMPLGDDAAIQRAIEQLQADLPKRMDVLRAENLDDNGDQHATHLEERITGDIVNLSAHTYFDQAEAYLPFLYPDALCALDFVAKDAVLILDEPHQARARWDQSEKEMGEIAQARAARGEWLTADLPTHCPFATLEKRAKEPSRTVILFSLLARPLDWLRIDHEIGASIPPMESFAGRLPLFFESLDSWLGNRLRCVIVSRQPMRMRELMADHQIAVAPNTRLQPGVPTGDVYVIEGDLDHGFKLIDASLMVLSDSDVFGTSGGMKSKRKSSFKEGLRITSYLELREGDYVVHIHHGIGIYRGLTRLKGKDNAVRDYLLLEYAGADKVYVPTDQVDRVQRYIGSDADAPTIHRLNSGEWQRATKAAKKQVQEMAAELIKLYAARKAATRPAYPPDTPWQEEMEEAFPYEETPGQLTAIEDIKTDLEHEHPMDRLICGDVGYGKTEVAIRAAFKAVNSGRQVAVLCPTTILAQQHLGTFRDRLAAYPVKVEMLSRFVSNAEAKKVAKGLMDGTVDIVIGTHRLLSKDVKFSRLGLLIVDEEQRFGVTHKEKIKQLKKSVDVLTLSATPIPRTLHMALSGIRDLSLINDPPEGRRPIKTYIREYDDELVREVVLRELDREGQVYYVSNRIESIYHMAERLNKLVPHAKVGVGHGQMGEDSLEEVMLKFYHKDYDILVCTTIIESGLDVSNVNTIIVDNADKLGLSQLYQLRGRVGRSAKQGYAYLLYRKDKVLSEVAEKRLSALRDFSELGSGYKVALRDLEIRGAGNLLGAEQSGTVAAVGFDLYTQLLSQAINELKGQPAEREFTLPPIGLPLDAHIPTRYIPSEAERILIYKKLTAVRKVQDVADIQEELEDRYGDPPRSVWNLLALLRLRLRCLDLRIGSIATEKEGVIIRFNGTHLTQEAIRPLARAFIQYQFGTDRVVMPLMDTPTKTLTAVEEMVEILAKSLPDKDKEARIGVSHGNGQISKPQRRLKALVGYR